MPRDVTPLSAYDDAQRYAITMLDEAAEDALAYLGVGWRSPQERGADTKALVAAVEGLVAHLDAIVETT